MGTFFPTAGRLNPNVAAAGHPRAKSAQSFPVLAVATAAMIPIGVAASPRLAEAVWLIVKILWTYLTIARG
jgi:hypothetical protein